MGNNCVVAKILFVDGKEVKDVFYKIEDGLLYYMTVEDFKEKFPNATMCRRSFIECRSSCVTFANLVIVPLSQVREISHYEK